MTKNPVIKEFNEYQRNGFVSLGIEISEDDLANVRDALENWIGDSPLINNYGILRNNAYKEVPQLASLLYKYKLGELACQLLQCSEVVLFQDNLIWKPEGTEQRVEWHQDYSYWPLSAPNGITFWIALDDVSTSNGCMRFIPQSHKWGECAATNFTTPGEADWNTSLPPLPWKEHENNFIDIELLAGQGVAHHPLLAHMSLPNPSRSPRRGWSLTWIQTEVYWDPEHAPHPYPIFHSVQKGDTVIGDDFPRFTQ